MTASSKTVGREYLLRALASVKIQTFSRLDRGTVEKLSGYDQIRGKRSVMRSVEYPEGYFVERTLALLFGLGVSSRCAQGCPVS